MGRWLAGLALSGLTLAGCGGSQLKPNEQKEYDALKQEQASIQKRIGAANAAADKAFRDAGAAEKAKKLVYKGVLVCGGSASGQYFGALPFTGKKKAALVSKRDKTVSGVQCETFDVSVK
ncbi:MAG: hypothetical protein H6702_07255 [Myxococcales bacterium]|nr:hypothetical protein [Myxococcales bacterium]